MLCIFRSVIVSDRLSQPCRVATEPSRQRNAHGSRCLLSELRQLCITSLAFHGHLHRLVAFAAGDRVCFPVADVAAQKNSLRALPDRHSLRNMGLFMFPGVSSVLARMVGSDQEGNEVRGFLVHPLINGLVADGQPRMFKRKPSRDKFRRPSQAKMLFDIPPDRVAFESCSPVGFALTPIRPFLSFMSQIVPGINRRSIALKLP